MDEGAIDIGSVIDGQGGRPFTVGLLALALLAVVADGYDLQAVAYAGPELVHSWQIARASLGPVFGASLFGLLLGSPLFGHLGDRFGRKVSIVAGCLIYGLVSLATRAAHSVGTLILSRFLVGIGLGGVLPNVIALIAEYVPKRRRAAAIILRFFGMPIGGALPGLVAVGLMPHFGWPVLFFVGGIGRPRRARPFSGDAGRARLRCRLLHRRQPELAQRRCRPALSDRLPFEGRRLGPCHGPLRLDGGPAARRPARRHAGLAAASSWRRPSR